MIPRRFFWFCDAITICFAFVNAYWLVPRIQRMLTSLSIFRVTWLAELSPAIDWSIEPASKLVWILLVSVLPTILFLEVAGRYGRWLQLSLSRIVIAGLAAPFMGMGTFAVVLFTLRNPSIKISRTFIFLFTMLSGVGLVAYRLAWRTYFVKRQKTGYYARNVLFIGLPVAVRWMARYFEDSISPAEYRPLGYLSILDSECAGPETATARVAEESLLEMGKVGELGDLLIHRPIHEVIAIQPPSGGEWIAKVVEQCDHLGILLRIVPEALILGERRRLRMLYPFQELNLPAVILAPPHWDPDSMFIKRLIDVGISGFFLTVLSPLFLLIAAAIKLTSPHLPIFYRWCVVGRNGVEFTGYKFTTMEADADERRKELLHRNEMSGPVFKIKDDPRMTSFGSFLRKYSLNELPQLWSVLKGDMSLVGPRPAFRHELERYDFWHKRKLSIKPGITCLWQIRGRNKITNFDEWVRMDLEYIDNWSLWLDFKILFRTGLAVIAGTGS